SSDKSKQKFDFRLFRRLMQYARPYRLIFIAVGFAAIMLSLFSSVRPILLKYTVDDYVLTKDANGLLLFVIYMVAALILEVISQLSFIYYANWLGQSVIKDIREKLFKHMMRFR